MDLGRLRTLQELAIRGTMASVADALRMSPSAVSQQIAQLEVEAGLPLVERRGRGVRLTAAGAKLTAHAGRIIGILEQARTDLAELRDVVGGEVRVAVFPSVAAAMFPKVMQAVRQAHPRLQVTLTELEPLEGLAALRAWQADAALIDDLTVAPSPAGLPDMTGGNFETVPIIEDHLYAVLPLGHRLARRRDIGLEDLRAECWAMYSPRNAFAQSVTAACERAGFTPEVNGQCASFEVVAALVEAGCSVAVMPGLRLGAFRGRLVTKRLRPEIRRNISVVFRRGERRNPALECPPDRDRGPGGTPPPARFRLRRHRIPATQYRATRTQAFQVWAEVTGVAAAA